MPFIINVSSGLEKLEAYQKDTGGDTPGQHKKSRSQFNLKPGSRIR